MPLFRTIISLIIAIFIFAPPVQATEIIERDDLSQIFEKFGATGTFALYAKADDKLILFNPKRAETRMIPASTFKIANSLIALETSVIRDKNEILPYGGKSQRIKAWEKDMPLKQAFRASNVPIYQGLARNIGTKNYHDWLAKLSYGNQKIGQDITSFWLDGPLKISAIEQARFLSKLANTQLNISKNSQRIVQDIAKIETKGDRALYGKTGWTVTPTPQLGWFVGWVTNDKGTYSFALNIDITERKDIRKREKLARDILAELGLF